jgi:glucokinase
MKILVGDIGGSHLTLGECYLDHQNVLLRNIFRTEIDSNGTEDEIINQWVKAIQILKQDDDEIAISMAMPAPFDYENGVCLIKDQSKFRSLYGINFKEKLSSKLNILPNNFHFLNDARAFLLGESFFGVAKNYKRVLGLTLGSGLGSSLKLNEEISDAGFWSKSFKMGIAEDYLGTGWFVKWSKDNLNINIKGLRNLLDPKHKNYHSILFNEFSSNLADFIEIIVIEYQIEAVVLAGGITNSANYFIPQTKQKLMERGITIDLQISLLGEQSILLGASTLIFEPSIIK